MADAKPKGPVEVVKEIARAIEADAEAAKVVSVERSWNEVDVVLVGKGGTVRVRITREPAPGVAKTRSSHLRVVK